MTNLFFILGGTLFIALGALAGIFTLSLKQDFLNRILLGMVGLSSGALLGGAFLHLLPEGLEKMEPEKLFLTILITIVVYLLIEKLLHWRHCHSGPACATHHTLGYMNLVGDSVHNFIDGLVIAAAFAVSPTLGFTTVLAIALHEIPQEIGDFGVLLYSGMEKKKALLLNFLVALTVVAGGIVGWALSAQANNISTYLLPVAGGGFIYIALSDILPEMRKEASLKKFLSGFVFILLGIAMMFFFRE